MDNTVTGICLQVFVGTYVSISLGETHLGELLGQNTCISEEDSSGVIVLHRNECVLQWWKPFSGTPGWGRNSWAEEPFKFGDCLFLALMTPPPWSAPKFLSTPVHLPHSRLDSYFQEHCC